MARIVIENLIKTFGAYAAVNGINLEIRDGEFLIMVGPSGCGKTTTLNMISGLETPTSGRIVIGDTVVNDLEPGERGLGMVFQDLALFPHMTVFENIAFGLRVKKVPEQEARKRVGAAARQKVLADYRVEKNGEGAIALARRGLALWAGRSQA